MTERTSWETWFNVTTMYEINHGTPLKKNYESTKRPILHMYLKWRLHSCITPTQDRRFRLPFVNNRALLLMTSFRGHGDVCVLYNENWKLCNLIPDPAHASPRIRQERIDWHNWNAYSAGWTTSPDTACSVLFRKTPSPVPTLVDSISYIIFIHAKESREVTANITLKYI